MVAKQESRAAAAGLLAVFLASSIGIGALGYRSYLSRKRAAELEIRGDLAAIAALKAEQIVQWRKERLADARGTFGNPLMLPAIRPVLRGSPAPAALLEWLETLRRVSGYSNVALFDSSGVVRFSLVKEMDQSLTQELARQAMSTRGVILTDLHSAPGQESIHMQLAVPLFERGAAARPIGVFMAWLDPQDLLYPILHSWPKPSRTAETLLIRREGNEVVHLSELRFRKDSALKLRLPIENLALPPGQRIAADAIDYRGVPVLTVIRPIPDTPWHLVAKIDSAEVFAEVGSQSRPVALIVGLLVAFMGAATGMLWRHLRVGFLRRQLRTEQALRLSEERYRTLFQCLGEGVGIVNKRGRFLVANPAAESIFGIPSGELAGRNAWSFVVPRDLPLARRQTEAFLRGRESACEIAIRRADGAEKTIQITGTPRLNPEGRLAEVVGVFRDVTEARQLEERVRLLAQALQSSDDCICITDVQDRFLYVNGAFLRTYGYQENELIGQHVGIVRSERNAPEALSAILPGTMEGGWHGELWNRTKSGREFPISLTTSSVRDDAGNAVALIGVARDISERKQAEAERTRLEEQLRQAQKLESVGRLAGGVAHDFNNLLTVINGYGDLLLARLRADDPVRPSLEQIRKAGERAANLTQQLLAFSRKQVVRPRLLDLNAQAQEAGQMLRRLLQEDIELVLRLDPTVGSVMADPGQLHQVLINLAVNAKDAMPTGGELLVETSSVELNAGCETELPEAVPGKYVLLTVTDTGTGMDAETREHIFEPFFTTKETGKGTGLGLATVYGIVRQNGGWIAVRSEPGKGTTFRIYLPRAEAGPAKPDAAPPPMELHGSETILVVEDQADVRRLATRVLEAHGYTTLQAGSGAEALQLVRDHAGPIHLLLTDVVMPGMNGRELAGELTPRRPEMKVLLMSGYSESVVARRGVLDPGFTLLAKPFTSDELASAVRRVLGAPAHPCQA
ncbi:MAG: PAS domain S-box protein [Acidobacteria bacterium]|nr:PAS domain S-box protein [Acidobacteriota bacterium]